MLSSHLWILYQLEYNIEYNPRYSISTWSLLVWPWCFYWFQGTYFHFNIPIIISELQSISTAAFSLPIQFKNWWEVHLRIFLDAKWILYNICNPTFSSLWAIICCMLGRSWYFKLINCMPSLSPSSVYFSRLLKLFGLQSRYWILIPCNHFHINTIILLNLDFSSLTQHL